MAFLLAVLAGIPIHFGFSPTLRTQYDVAVQFKGYLPLLGGRDAKVDIDMKLDVLGKPNDSSGNTQITSEVKDFKLLLNDSAMPFGTGSVQKFFPLSTISVTPEGKTIKTDATDQPMPVRLPGLDARRLPDISFLPVEFPIEGIELGKSFSFGRRFGSNDMEYEVTPTSIDDKTVVLSVKVHQEDDAYEDESRNPVTEEKGKIRIHTTLTGGGTVSFDRTVGLVALGNIEAEALSQATDLVKKTSTDRHLHTSLKMKRLVP